MSKFDLRDISERLAASRDTEAVVFEFLGYLQAVRSDWRASLAFYEVSRDALVNIYERHGNRLARKDVVLPADDLPPRLVRKFFHPSAFFNTANRRSLLTHLFQSSPYYEPDPIEAPGLMPLTPIPNWQSCVCLPLADQEDLIAMVVIVSDRKGAFGSKTIGEIIPLKSMAALALAQHLHRSARPRASDDRSARAAAAEFQERIRRLNAETAELTEENKVKAARLQALACEIELLDKSSNQYKQELDGVKSQLFALEEQSAAATQHLSEAYSQLTDTQTRLAGLQSTVGFLKEAFQVLSQEHDPDAFSHTLVTWFCEHFGLDRCSLMVLDGSKETLRISAQQGIDPAIADNVKVRVGQGIAGWVAHNRKPLLVRVRKDAESVKHTHQDAYNSDSFISVPLIYNNRLRGVLNLSNKRDGEPFDDLDLDRALLAGSIMAMTLGAQDVSRRSAAWA
ncbi:MAG TPA: GAF domain-containing protein [Candidatus Limnocylindria bacterium]|nr:GAF domain-containing protein [Candidatus Limnocylindria bacterium]